MALDNVSLTTLHDYLRYFEQKQDLSNKLKPELSENKLVRVIKKKNECGSLNKKVVFCDENRAKKKPNGLDYSKQLRTMIEKDVSLKTRFKLASAKQTLRQKRRTNELRRIYAPNCENRIRFIRSMRTHERQYKPMLPSFYWNYNKKGSKCASAKTGPIDSSLKANMAFQRMSSKQNSPIIYFLPKLDSKKLDFKIKTSTSNRAGKKPECDVEFKNPKTFIDLLNKRGCGNHGKFGRMARFQYAKKNTAGHESALTLKKNRKNVKFKAAYSEQTLNIHKTLQEFTICFKKPIVDITEEVRTKHNAVKRCTDGESRSFRKDHCDYILKSWSSPLKRDRKLTGTYSQQ